MENIPITKEQFIAYEKVRESGVTNMLDLPVVSQHSGGMLNDDDVRTIIINYKKIVKIFPDVRRNN